MFNQITHVFEFTSKRSLEEAVVDGVFAGIIIFINIIFCMYFLLLIGYIMLLR